jgi:hypothetical protein
VNESRIAFGAFLRVYPARLDIKLLAFTTDAVIGLGTAQNPKLRLAITADCVPDSDAFMPTARSYAGAARGAFGAGLSHFFPFHRALAARLAISRRRVFVDA